ncbi:MAG: thioredoxin domain-containing protein [Gammaproteobacteria bacterium]|nr:thioredoxin domain-containing protein [Gammaproteobacteria bacterium]
MISYNQFSHIIIIMYLMVLYSLFGTASVLADDTWNRALKDKGKDYQPRTEHLNADGSPQYTNRLILEQSPYLIQHAHNPVNWYAWGKEAFATAQRENKPIFLSIGYSTCHWCHVMERESFDNETIAAYLNKHFIAIKVDRERRPDVDKTYMTALTLLNGSGGWPMSSLLTPQGKPFYSGTYFPPMSFMQVLTQVEELWKTDESRLRKIGDSIAQAVQDYQKGQKQTANISQEQIALATIA